MRSLLRFPQAALVLLIGLGLCPTARAASAQELAKDEEVLKKAGAGVDGPGLLQFFRKRTLTPADQRRVQQLVNQLGDETYRTRNRAHRELLAIGPPALPALRKALQSPDTEVRGRAARCIYAIEKSPGPDLPLAALRLLRARKPDGACSVLLAYLPFADNEDVLEEAVAALPDVGFKGGKADPALPAALRDSHPVRRAAAALTLGRRGDAEQHKAVRKLLADADPQVRLRAAHGLLLGKDKSGVPALIRLLADGPLETAQKAEELLSELTDAQVSKVELAADAKARRQVQKAWAAWWTAEGPRLDLARLQADGLVRTKRAQKVTRESLDALLKLDVKGFKKTLNYPFYMQGAPGGGNEIKDGSRIDQMFDMLAKVQEIKEQLKKIHFKITGTGKADEYLQSAQPPEKAFLGKFRKGELVIVYLKITMDGQQMPEGEGAMFVRITGGRAYVVGLGNSQRKKK